jgi:hypothetical protein
MRKLAHDRTASKENAVLFEAEAVSRLYSREILKLCPSN